MSNLVASWKPGIKNCKLGKEGPNLVSTTERMSKERLLQLFILKFRKSETSLILLAKAKLVVYTIVKIT